MAASNRPNQQLNQRLNTVMESAKNLKLDAKVVKAINTVLNDLADALNQDVKPNIVSLVQNAVHMLESIGEFDSEFLLEQFEELKPHKKGKKVMVQEFLNEQVRGVDPSLVAHLQVVIGSAQVSSEIGRAHV